MATIDLITVSEYYKYIEKSYTCPLDETGFKVKSYALFITQASSYFEEYCRRPFITGSDVEVPTDSAGDEIEKYQAYASMAVLPAELKYACCLLVNYYKMKAEHFGISSTGDDTKTKSYRIYFPQEVHDILKKYKYYPIINEWSDRLD